MAGEPQVSFLRAKQSLSDAQLLSSPNLLSRMTLMNDSPHSYQCLQHLQQCPLAPLPPHLGTQRNQEYQYGSIYRHISYRFPVSMVEYPSSRFVGAFARPCLPQCHLYEAACACDPPPKQGRRNFRRRTSPVALGPCCGRSQTS